MVDHPRSRAQRGAANKVAILSSLIGLFVIAAAILGALWLAPDARVQTNVSDQPSASAPQQQGTGDSRATSGDNSGASGNASRLGSGPPGSGAGSPTGSSSNVTGSTPSQSGPRSDAPGTATR
jgi:hypothetical protein